MRQLFLAALGVFAVSGVASAQQPQTYPQPAPFPVVSPAAAASRPIIPASGATTSFKMVGGDGCAISQPCNNGCGSAKGDFAFQFGSCKSFFSPCGPGSGGGLFGGGLFGGRCPKPGFAQPWGQGWTCPPIYDTYANH